MVLIILILLILLLLNNYLFSITGLREAFSKTTLQLFSLTVALTELFSLGNLLTRPGIVYTWVSITGITLIWLLFRIKRGKKLDRLDDLLMKLRQLSWIEWVIILCISLILIVTLVTALLSPPNNYDSMTYHMSRIVHWIQNKSVRFYPTAIPRQNYSMPLSEYMILQLQLLSRSDKYANLVQWSGFILSILAASELSKQLKVSRIGQFLTAFFVATLPMAIVQSTNTQNDLLTGLFCIYFASYMYKNIHTYHWQDTIYAGLSLGLALLTKGTAYVYCGIIGLVIGGYGLLKFQSLRKKAVLLFSVIILIALVLNAGIYSRNFNLYFHPLSSANDRIVNENISIRSAYSNLIRNGALQLAIPIPRINEKLTDVVTAHLGSSSVDPRTTFPGTRFNIEYLINEDQAGNLMHFIFLLLMFVILPWSKTTKDQPAYLIAGMVVLSTFFFSLLFRWQPWGSRLQLPIFFIGAPLIGIIKDRMKFSSGFIMLSVFIVMVYSMPYLLLNSTRPLVPIFPKGSPFRTKQITRFFSDRPNLYDEYSEIIAPFYKNQSILRTDRQELYFSGNMSIYDDYHQVMSKVRDLESEMIGLYLGSNDWEYPIWVMANQTAVEGFPLFKHIAVNDISHSLEPDLESLPEYIIATEKLEPTSLLSMEYDKVVNTSSISLLKKCSTPCGE